MWRVVGRVLEAVLKARCRERAARGPVGRVRAGTSIPPLSLLFLRSLPAQTTQRNDTCTHLNHVDTHLPPPLASRSSEARFQPDVGQAESDGHGGDCECHSAVVRWRRGVQDEEIDEMTCPRHAGAVRREGEARTSAEEVMERG